MPPLRSRFGPAPSAVAARIKAERLRLGIPLKEAARRLKIVDRRPVSRGGLNTIKVAERRPDGIGLVGFASVRGGNPAAPVVDAAAYGEESGAWVDNPDHHVLDVSPTFA